MSERSERSQRAMDEILGASAEQQPATSARLRREAPERRTPSPESPLGLIIVGIVVSFIGGIALTGGLSGDMVWLTFVGAAVVGVAWVSVVVGVVAMGVRLGMRWHRYERGE